jgi:hypothetical protein
LVSRLAAGSVCPAPKTTTLSVGLASERLMQWLATAIGSLRAATSKGTVSGKTATPVPTTASSMNAALDDPDPWQGFAAFLERALELQAADRGLRELVLGAPGGRERIARLRAQLYPLGARLVQRAREAGQLRADCETEDIAMVQLMLGLVIDAAQDVGPELWRRYLSIVFQGLRANPGPPGPLAPPALSPERMDEVLVASWNARRRG